MNIQSLSEKIPIEETIKAIEYIKYERNIEKLKIYIDEIMPFGEKASVKYRNKFIQRFVVLEGEQVIYSPVMEFINNIQSYQTKKEVIYFIVCTTSDAVGEMGKAFYKCEIPNEIDEEQFAEVFNKSMTNAKESSIKKTYSVVTTILQDFNIIKTRKDIEGKKIYYINESIRPSYEGILFNLYYEFLKIKENKMPEVDAVLDCDTFKYFIMSDLMKKRYLKWMVDRGYIEHYVMGGNTKYQFSMDSLKSLIKKVIGDD